MAMLNLFELPKTGERLRVLVAEKGFDSGFDSNETMWCGRVMVALDNSVLIERSEGKDTCVLPCGNRKDAVAVAEEINFFLRLIHAELIDLADLPGFGPEHLIVRKSDITRIGRDGSRDGSKIMIIMENNEQSITPFNVQEFEEAFAIIKLIRCS